MEGSSNTIRRVYRCNDDAWTTGRYFVKGKGFGFEENASIVKYDERCFELSSEVGVPCRDWSKSRELVGLHPRVRGRKERTFKSWSRLSVICSFDVLINEI